MKKCILSLILSLTLVFNMAGMTAFAQGKSSTLFSGGTGTETDPYLITTADDLKTLTTEVNGTDDKIVDGATYKNQFFKLVNDIDLKGTETNQWTSIGTYLNSTINEPFSGTFDGNGKTITGLYMNINYNGSTVNMPNIGLFGYLKEATVKNLTVSGGSLVVSDNVWKIIFMGGIAGKAHSSIIDNCHNAGVTITSGGTKGNHDIGGIVGESCDSKIMNCQNHATLQMREGVWGLVGGVVGTNGDIGGNPNTSSTMVNCVNFGDVSIDLTKADQANTYGGGVAGGNYDGSEIRNCANFGAVSSNGPYSIAGYLHGNATGGVVGRNQATVVNCFNSGTVSTGKGNLGYVGNVVGLNNDMGGPYPKGIVQHCYGNGTANSNTPNFAGNLKYPIGDPEYNAAGEIAGCGSFDASGVITLMNDYKDTDQGTKTETYAKGGTALVDAMNNWVKASDKLQGANLWKLNADGNLVPTFPEMKHTITFNPSGGIVTPATAKTTDLKLTDLPTPTKSGYTFNGWFTQATDGTPVTTATVFTKDTTIYAHWTVIPGSGDSPSDNNLNPGTGDNGTWFMMIAAMQAALAGGSWLLYKKTRNKTAK